MEESPLVTAVRADVLAAVETGIRTYRTVPPPMVHLFDDHADEPYVGCVTIRPHDRGDDAAWALRGLGHAAAMLRATRILVVWEESDLLLAFGLRSVTGEQSVVMLEATLEDCTVTRYPFTTNAADELLWGEARTTQPVLREPFADLLANWCEGYADDFVGTIGELVESGYTYYAPPKRETMATHDPEDVDRAVAAALADGAPAAVDRACTVLRDALDAMAERDPRRGFYLVNLSLVLQLRFENGGDPQDIDDAVRAAREAEPFPDGASPAKRLNALGTALRTLYEHTSDGDALRASIDASRQALAAMPAGDRNSATCLVNLATALHVSFMADGRADDLDEALAITRRGLVAVGTVDPRHEVVAMTLGILLLSKYNRTGDRAVLEEAIEHGRAAGMDTMSSGWMLAARLHNFALTLVARYHRTGDVASLLEATEAVRQALAEAPAEHVDRTTYQLCLSDALRGLFHRTGDRARLDEAFSVASDAVQRVSADHPFRRNHLGTLAMLHHLRYTETPDLAELDAAEMLLREALADCAATHPQRPALVSTLADVLNARSAHTGDVRYLDDGLRLVHAVLGSIAEDHQVYGPVLRSLADAYTSRYEDFGDDEALLPAIEHLRAAAGHRASPMRFRVDAARQWGTTAAAAGLAGSALEGFATAVELLPLLAARSQRRPESEYWLSEYGGLAGDAAALALAADDPDRALMLVELGRTVLLAQALELRTDLTELRAQDAVLAARFESLSACLELEPGDQTVNRWAVVDELDAVVAAARELPGLDRFLLPPLAADLVAQAAQGPVVVVNVSKYRCDALLLTTDGLRALALPQLTVEVLNERVAAFLTALRKDCASKYRRARERGERTIVATLAWLGDAVTAPVLDALTPPAGQRMWWVPTGLLVFLPLHAAGSDTPGHCVLDRMVSSYAPSVRALTHARGRTTERSGPTLVVAVPQTPGFPDLPKAVGEARAVAGRAPRPRTLIGPAATRQAVIAGLRGSAWAHFACHAVIGTGTTDSHLVLHDQHALSATEVARERLPAATLAYLSACDTAAPTAELADEVLHIASAFHLAGFSQVIGTLWSVEDDAAAAIADLVYVDLTEGAPDADRASGALHRATVRMRDKNPHRPSTWASHVHIGS